MAIELGNLTGFTVRKHTTDYIIFSRKDHIPKHIIHRLETEFQDAKTYYIEYDHEFMSLLERSSKS